MQPVLTLEYMLSMESFISFTYSENIKAMEKGKKNIKTMSVFQIFIGISFSILMATQGTTSVFTLLISAVMVALGFLGVYKFSKFDEKLMPTIQKNYFQRKYDKYPFKIDFYEDELVYSFNDQKGNLEYYQLVNVAKSTDYLALGFSGGQIVIFDKDCDYDKILKIVQKNLGVEAN